MRGSRRRGDRGFVLIFFALTIVSLLVFAAFAIDLGALYNHRRQDQNAADAASLAAAQEIGQPVSSLVAAAKEYAEDTLGVTLTAAEWDSCAAPPAGFTAASGSRCISYNTRQVRVRLPDRAYETTFGRVVGVDSFEHNAFAIAALQQEGFGGVLPYAVTGSSANGGFGCLQSDSNGQASAWCGSSSGNFGFLNFGQYGNPDLGTSKSCESGDISDRLRDNTAMGVDHDLALAAEDVDTTIIDARDACDTLTPGPDSARTQTGNQTNDITAGLFSDSTTFSDGLPSRLRRKDANLLAGAGQQTTVLGVDQLDNNALWRLIPANYGPGETTTANIPSSCKRDQFVDANGDYYVGLTNPDIADPIEAFLDSPGLAQPRDRILGLLARCFFHYQGQSWNGFPVGSLVSPEDPAGCSGTCSSPVFALNSSTTDTPDLFDIQYTPRFGYVPQIVDFPNGTSEARQFLRFRPIFLYRLLIQQGGDTEIFDPGFSAEPSSTGAQLNVGETSVFVFPDGMLPGGLAGDDAPFEIDVNRFIRLIR